MGVNFSGLRREGRRLVRLGGGTESRGGAEEEADIHEHVPAAAMRAAAASLGLRKFSLN